MPSASPSTSANSSSTAFLQGLEIIELGVREIRPEQADSVQVGPDQVGTTQVASVPVGPVQRGPEQIGIVYVDVPVGQFNRPTGVCVDDDGDIYIADWLNNRVQVLTSDGRFLTEFTGDATLSSLGVDKIKSNPDMVRQRNGVRDYTPEKVLWAPCAVRVDHRGRVLIADTSRHRFQVYQKNSEPMLV